MAKQTKATEGKAPRFTPEVLEQAVSKRAEFAAIDAYLKALEAPKARGRKPDVTKKRAALAETIAELPGATGIRKITLAQARIDLEAEIARLELADDADAFAELERGFAKAVKGYSDRKGISYAAWRAIGVPAKVLSEGGLKP